MELAGGDFGWDERDARFSGAWEEGTENICEQCGKPGKS